MLDGITPGRASCSPDVSHCSEEENLSYHDQVLSVLYKLGLFSSVPFSQNMEPGLLIPSEDLKQFEKFLSYTGIFPG